MLWLTWRQHRRQARFAVIGLAVMAALMIPTGKQMHDAFGQTGLADCLRARSTSADVDCAVLASEFGDRFGSFTLIAILFVLLPLLVGMLAGAPLVASEVELGTHRLVWTQGASRRRWALVKIGAVTAAAVVVAAGYALLLSWWITPLGRATGNQFLTFIFDVQGIVPVAYTLFAVSLGIFAGTVTRKVLPAMATTLVGFLVLRLVVALEVRPRFMAQQQRAFPTASEGPDPLLGDWVTSVAGVFDATGRRISTGQARCSPPEPGTSVPAAPTEAAASVPDSCASGAYNLEFYHPASRFWPFQFIETGLYVALAALLLLLAIHQVSRRIA